MADAVRSANRGVSWSRVGTRQLLNWAAIASTILSSAAQRRVAAAQSTADGAGAGTSIVRVDATPGHVINSFDPDSALGSPHIIQESAASNVWINDGPNSHADPDNPPVATTIKGAPGTVYTLPKASITVLRGKVGALKD